MFVVSKDLFNNMAEKYGMIEKSRKANIGEVRDWHGQKVKKVAEGKWVPVTEGKGPAKEDVKASKGPGKKVLKEKKIKSEEPKKESPKPAEIIKDYKPGSTVSVNHENYEGEKFSVSSKDQDGSYHLVSTDGKKGLHVSGSKLKQAVNFNKGDTVAFTMGGNDLIGKFVKEDEDKITVVSSEGEYYDVPISNVHSGEEAEKTLMNKNKALPMFSEEKWKQFSKFKEGEEGLQPATTAEEILKLTKKDHQPLVDMCENLAKMFNLPKENIIMRTKFKDIKRATEKLELDYKEEMIKNGKSDIKNKDGSYNYSTIRDWDGGTVVFNNMSDLNKALDYLAKQDSVIRIKNNFAKKNNPTGYCDVNINVRLPNGTVSEIQLNTPSNIISKNSYGHSLYEITRSEKISKDKKYAELKKSLEDGQKEIYNKSNELSLKQTVFELKDNNYFADQSVAQFNEIAKPIIQKNNKLIEQAFNEGAIDSKTYSHYQQLANKVFD